MNSKDLIDDLLKLKSELQSGSFIDTSSLDIFKSDEEDIKNLKQYINQFETDKAVELINNTEQPQQMSYWLHNLFGDCAPEARLFMILKDKHIEMLDYKASKRGIYSNRLHGNKFRAVLIKKARGNYASNRLGEYFKDEKIGVVIAIPKDFLQIYRWAGKGKGSIEWMGKPQTIATGDSYAVKFTMYAIPAKDSEAFMKKMLAVKPLQSRNATSVDKNN